MSRYITTADVHQKCKLKHQQDKTQNGNYTQYPQSYHSQRQVSELTARCFSYTYPCSCHINGTYCIVTALSQFSQIPQLKREADLLSVQISHNYNGATLANILTIFVRRMLLFRHLCNLNSAKQYKELHVPLSVGLDTHLALCPPVPSGVPMFEDSMYNEPYGKTSRKTYTCIGILLYTLDVNKVFILNVKNKKKFYSCIHISVDAQASQSNFIPKNTVSTYRYMIIRRFYTSLHNMLPTDLIMRLCSYQSKCKQHHCTINFSDSLTKTIHPGKQHFVI